MNSRGVDFLELWLDRNMPFPKSATVSGLVERLTNDAAKNCVTLSDMGLDIYSPEKYVSQSMAYTREQVFD